MFNLVRAFPNTIAEFQDWFATEEACHEYLAKVRWPEGFRCPRCGGARGWPTKRGLVECATCRLQTTVTAGTIFQDTRKPLRMWFLAMWLVTSQKHGVSALGLKRALGLGSYRTAWSWFHKLRRAMVRPGRDRLRGTVEVDETYVAGKRPGKPGRGAGKTLVLIAVETNDGKVGRARLVRLSDASGPSLGAAVEAAVEPGSTVETDGWAGYAGLDSRGYSRRVVRRGGTAGDDLLPHAHLVASLLKRWLLGTHQGAVRASHLDYYLDEFTFRFNRRTSRSRGLLFYRLVEQAVQVDPWPAKRFTPARVEGKPQDVAGT